MDNIFDLTTTDVPFYDKLLRNKCGFERNKPVIAYVSQFTPDQYLKEVSEQQECTMEEVYKMVSESNLNHLNQVIENGEKLPLLFLNRVINRQEGRHRAILAKRLNYEFVPVLIIEEKSK